MYTINLLKMYIGTSQQCSELHLPQECIACVGRHLNVSESLAKPLVMANLNMAYLTHLSKFKNQKTAFVLTASASAFGHIRYFVPPAYHCIIWCQSTFGPCGSVFPLNPAMFTFYLTKNYAILLKQCLNYNACISCHK